LSRLIVGLGNVGLKYEKTRHNAGFMILEALAEKVKIKFKEESRFKGKIAVGIKKRSCYFIKTLHLYEPKRTIGTENL